LHLTPTTISLALLASAPVLGSVVHFWTRRTAKTSPPPPPVDAVPQPAPALPPADQLPADPDALIAVLRDRLAKTEATLEGYQKFANEALVAKRMHGTAMDAAQVRLQDTDLVGVDGALLDVAPRSPAA
jgi:hypothetical protein